MHTTTIEQASERESKPISNNIKRQVHDREGKRERELLSIAEKRQMNEHWNIRSDHIVDSSLAKNNSHIWCTIYTFTASLTR
jgi:hypothetical protein